MAEAGREAMSAFRFEEYPYAEIPEAVWDAWADCARRWNAMPYLAPTWMRGLPWMAGCAPDARLLAARSGKGDYLGFWPYQVTSKRARGILTVRTCSPWNGGADCDPGVSTRMRFWALCAPDPPPGFPEAFVRAFLDRGRWHHLKTGELRMDQPLCTAWEDALEEYRLPFRKSVKVDAVMGSWDGFEDFLRSLGKDWRKAYRRIRRAAEEEGRLRIEVVSDFPGDALDRAVGRMAAIYRGSWKSSSGAAAVNLALEDTLSAFAARLAAFAREGGAHAVFVTVDGEDAAFDVCVRHGDMYCDLQSAFLEKHADLGIGYLSIMESNRHMIGRGMRGVNQFGYEDYKKHHGAESASSFSYEVYGRGPAGRILSMVHSARRRFRQGKGAAGHATRSGSGGGPGDGGGDEWRGA